MTSPLARNILKIPGKLVKDPTNLSLPYPYGGTEIGVCRDNMLTFNQKVDFPMAEEFGAPAAAILGSETPYFGCVLRSWDDSMVSAVWHNIQTASSGEVGIIGKVSGVSINRAGTNLVSRGFKLLFAPIADDRHPSVLLYNAIPMPNESAELQLSIGREMGIALIFHALPDSTGRTYIVDRRSNISL